MLPLNDALNDSLPLVFCQFKFRWETSDVATAASLARAVDRIDAAFKRAMFTSPMGVSLLSWMEFMKTNSDRTWPMKKW
jgi:hypothetical protein